MRRIRTRTWAIRSVLTLALVAPLGLLAVRPPREPAAPAGPQPAAADPARERRETVRAELGDFVGRGGRFTLMKILEPGSRKFLSFLQDRGFYVLTMYVPRRHLDPAARTRLMAVLDEAGVGPGDEAGDFVMVTVFDPDQATELAARVFEEVYQLGPEYELTFSGD